ncbi:MULTISPECIES: thioesterase family protein [unclassified Streptomyces]|uniref:acyl-CoA thioesterase n=1 Tax=unclassified Streptomyces TaxID=2593676 RepID=UPI000C27DD9C|nr:thioesterase family protein [Streptomyces sp. CB01201]PJN01697.1 thioesterase [Streptomyces sp. CB01201]
MEPFTVRIVVRGYETDAQGHLNQSVYLQYAEHGRWCALEHGGIRQSDLLAKGVGPVTMETTIRYRRELRAGDEVDVSCAFAWGEGKSFRIEQTIRRVDDGTLAAEVTAVCGILDLAERKLVPDPRDVFLALASDTAVFGLQRPRPSARP